MSVSAFQGTPRFEILSRLGAGGMGVVFEALDRERQVRIALKALPHIEAGALYRFKQEFRALADLVHPNLATLHELIEYQGTWFFTMELVDGTDFLRYVRGAITIPPSTFPEGSQTTSTIALDPSATRPLFPPASEDTPVEGTPGPPTDLTRWSPLVQADQFERLRRALAELADGLSALHAAGKLHRDIKPSNVLVTTTGRVVLVDFGLVQDMTSLTAGSHEEGEIAGTFSYMSPEQAGGRQLSPASDWYAVGVILFQALTGRLPFETQGTRLLAEKQRYEAPSVSGIVPNAPADLIELCQKLLARLPGRRPTGIQVREILRGSTDLKPVAHFSEPAATEVFVGRQKELAQLQAAAEQGRAQTVVVFVHGCSGVGKSWLMQHFLDDLTAQNDDVVLLAGRCYERESVPYKALDGLLDSLSRYLRRQLISEIQGLLPADVSLLARLFPVLRRVQPIASTPAAEIVDQRELRRRAFAALRELLARLGQSRRLILYIDDLQWGDLDSAALLTELLAPPSAPRLCLFCSYRREYAESSACLQALLAERQPFKGGQTRRELPIEPLDAVEARQLAQALLEEGGGKMDDDLAAAIARESEGGPYFIRELVHYLHQGKGASAVAQQKITLDQVLGERVDALPAGARRLLEAAAVAGKPIRQRDCFRAADLGGDDVGALRLLQGAHLIRGTGGSAQDEIEIYHDRIREIVSGRLTGAVLIDYHGRLASVLEAAGDVDPESLAIHFQGSGANQKACLLYHEAAVQASTALAFDRAVRLYRLSLAAAPAAGKDACALQAGLAKALTDAGRAPEAGDAYRAAARTTAGTQALELRMEAARHYLLSGHVEQGLSELRHALVEVGLPFPRRKSQAVASLVWRSLRLRFRELKVRTRAAIAAEELLRLDVCIMAGGSLGYYDLIRSLDFSSRAAHLALDLGESSRVVEALAVLAMAEAGGGGRSRKRTDRLIHAAQAACDLKPTPYLEGVMDCIRGEAAYLCGQYREGLLYSSRAEETFRERCTGRVHNLAFSRTYILFSHLFLGNLTELARVAPALVADAQERGDVSFVAMHRAFVLPFVCLVEDDPERAGALAEQAQVDWGDRESHFIETLALLGSINTALYAGRFEHATALAARGWQRWKLSPNRFVHSFCIEMYALRGRCALASHGQTRDRNLLRTAQKLARQLERERMPRCRPLAELLRAAVAVQLGKRSEAVTILRAACNGFEVEGMGLHAAVARRRLGELSGDERGHGGADEAEEWMRGQGIKNPRRMTELIAPGFQQS